jgi:hypothetical protein
MGLLDFSIVTHTGTSFRTFKDLKKSISMAVMVTNIPGFAIASSSSGYQMHKKRDIMATGRYRTINPVLVRITSGLAEYQIHRKAGLSCRTADAQKAVLSV